MNQLVAVRMLDKLGCRSDVAANGLEAVEAVSRIAYDVVLMDCQMPVMDGFAATPAIRASEISSGRRTTIIAITANALQGDREECLDAGMDDYLSKPVQIAELDEILRRWATPAARQDGDSAAGVPDDERCRADRSPLDSSLLDALKGDGEASDLAFVAALVDRFFVESAERLSSMRSALDSAEAATIQAAAHSLKGSSATMGASHMSSLCAELEAHAKSGSLDEAASLLRRIEKEHGRVRDALTALQSCRILNLLGSVPSLAGQ